MQRQKQKLANEAAQKKMAFRWQMTHFSTVIRRVLCNINTVSALQTSEPLPLQTNYSIAWQDKWVLKETSETQSAPLDFELNCLCFTADWFLMVNHSSLGSLPKSIDVRACHQMVVGEPEPLQPVTATEH